MDREWRGRGPGCATIRACPSTSSSAAPSWSTAPARPAERRTSAVLGDRILAVGEPRRRSTSGRRPSSSTSPAASSRPASSTRTAIRTRSVLLDGALASHLHQGFTTQLSGNCGDGLAPVTEAGREAVELSMAPAGLRPDLDDVRRVPGDRRGAAARPERRLPRRPRHPPQRRPGAEPGAADSRRGRRHGPSPRRGARRGRVRALLGPHLRPGSPRPTGGGGRPRAGGRPAGRPLRTHMRNECGGLFGALDEALATARAAGDGVRLQVCHLKAGARAAWGRAGEAVALLERARAEGLDVAADQYPYTAAATTLQASCRRRSWPCRSTRRSPPSVTGRCGAGSRRRSRPASPAGRTSRPTPAGTRSSSPNRAPTRRGRAARSAPLGRDLDLDPADVACDILVADRLASQVTSSTAWTRPTSRRSWPSPGSPSAPTPRGAGPAIPCSTRACRTRAPTAARRASWAVRPRARRALARDRGREADVGSGGAPRPPRPRRRPRGRLRRPRRLRPGDRRRPGDLRDAGGPPASGSTR